MRKIFFLILILLVSQFVIAQTSLEEFLNSQSQIKSVEKTKGNDFFNSTYKIMIKQPLDHSDTTNGFFLQRVFVADKGISNPVLLITEGYHANYAMPPSYINELSPMLNTNQIFVEHRYFGESYPEQLDWKYLTVENAAADHHAITELFQKYYKEKWINTNISKSQIH